MQVFSKVTRDGRLSARTGLAYRLPTEAKREYACRAGTDTAYHSGGNAESFRRTGRSSYDVQWGIAKRTEPVGSLAASEWGLCGTHDNVREWCQDSKGEYAGALQVDPGIQ